jgi:energy-converting hydrogenase Eha subunit F
VTLQATAVYLFSIIVFCKDYFLGIFILGRAGGDYEGLIYATGALDFVVSYLFPIIFCIYVWITIKCRGYLPSATGRMKELVRIYFYKLQIF